MLVWGLNTLALCTSVVEATLKLLQAMYNLKYLNYIQAKLGLKNAKTFFKRNTISFIAQLSLILDSDQSQHSAVKYFRIRTLPVVYSYHLCVHETCVPYSLKHAGLF